MKSILVVDDDPALRQLVAQLLGTRHAVTQATDAKDALRILGEGLTFDLFVFDVMMPGMDGIELARTVKKDERWAATPIVFLTTKGRFEDVVEGINVGARHYVTKPFKAADLLAKVDKILVK